MVDPDLQIRRGEGGGGGRKGRTQSQKKLFRPRGPQFGLKIRGGGGGGRSPGPLPWIHQWNMQSFELISSKTVDWQLSCLDMGEDLKKMAIH